MAITKFIPALWSAALLERFAASEVIAPTTNRDYEGTVRSGNTVRITSIATPTIVDYKNAGRTITPEELSDSQIDLVIDQEKAFAFKVDDVDRVQAAGSFEPVTADASKALAEDAESYLGGLFLTGGTNGDPGGTTTPTAVDNGQAAFDMVNALRTALGNALVPASNRYLLVNPDFSGYLLGSDSKLTAADVSGSPEGLRNATVGRLLGFHVVESPLFSPGKAACVAYHGSALAYANQIEKTEALRAQDSFADVVRSLHVYGAKVVRSTAIQYWQAA